MSSLNIEPLWDSIVYMSYFLTSLYIAKLLFLVLRRSFSFSAQFV